MRITRIEIGRWRNLRGVTIELGPNADFVCLVGENGAGKSNILELIAYAVPQLGLGEATVKRPFPATTEEPFEILLTLEIAGAVADEEIPVAGLPAAAVAEWDGKISFAARGEQISPDQQHEEISFPYAGGSSSPTYRTWQGVYANGVSDLDVAGQLGQYLASVLQQREQVLHLFLDAERVFPDITVTDAEVLERSRQINTAPQLIRQQATHATQNLYIEWMRSMLGDQQRRNEDFIEVTRLAQGAGQPVPLLPEPLDSYRAALVDVLPHLRFLRLDNRRRRLIYDSAGAELPYEELSGGERELAFLVGQLERFGIEDGLFLLDEPELHLNAELLQRWLSYLRSSIAAGQVWIATHSLEAVEAAGRTATLVLERNEDRAVTSARSLEERRVLATLAPLLGTPAFSIAASTFVLVEGERAGRERERFVQVSGAGSSVRFLEAGGCLQVAAKFQGLRLLASESEQLRVGAVVDRDHRSEQQVADFEAEHGVSVLTVHEIENFFLQPELLDALLAQRGESEDGHSFLRDACDHLAGTWVWDRVVYQQEWRDVPGGCQAVAQGLGWSQIEADVSAAAHALLEPLEATNPSGTSASQRRAAVAATIRRYGELREDRERLWMAVSGKEVLRQVASALDLSDAEALESRAARLWRDGEVQRPVEAVALGEYAEGLALLG